ncbi:unnamed protein product [Amoebophrya sp. A25]|nr:unnamed protein product [Amoebophrya sp. A25]|eukprot:GSA25T00022980001.1
MSFLNISSIFRSLRRFSLLIFLLLDLNSLTADAVRTIVFSYDRRDADEVPWLSGFREVNGLYAYRWDYEYRFYDKSRFAEAMTQTWIKVFQGYQILVDEFGSCGSDPLEELRDILGEKYFEEIHRGGSAGDVDHYFADARDDKARLRLGDDEHSESDTTATTSTSETSTSSSLVQQELQYLKDQGSATLGFGDFRKPQDLDKCENDFQIMFLDSDAVWHAHEVSVESLFPERLQEKGGFIATAADVHGIAVPVPHTNAWVARGAKGRELLRKWRYQYKYVRHMWRVASKEEDGEEFFKTCSGEKKWICTNYVLRYQPEKDTSTSPGTRITSDYSTKAATTTSTDSSTTSTRAVYAGYLPPVEAYAPIENGRNGRPHKPGESDCIYPYHGWDPLSLMSLIAESAYWDSTTSQVMFDGFEIPPWSRMNLPSPWSLAVRAIPPEEEVASGAVKAVDASSSDSDSSSSTTTTNSNSSTSSSPGHHYLTVENDDTEMIARNNRFYRWWSKRRSGIEAAKFWTSAPGEEPLRPGGSRKGEVEVHISELLGKNDQSDSAANAAAATKIGVRTRSTSSREDETTTNDTVVAASLSRAPSLRATFSMRRPLLQHAGDDDSNKKMLQAYNQRGVKTKQTLSADTVVTGLAIREVKKNAGGATQVSSTGEALYPVRWVLCTHFHWKNRANYTGHDCNRERYTPLTFLFFTSEYMARHWPQVKGFRSRPGWLNRIEELKSRKEQMETLKAANRTLLEKHYIEPEAAQRGSKVTLFERWGYAGLLKYLHQAPVEQSQYPTSDLELFKIIREVYPSSGILFGASEGETDEVGSPGAEGTKDEAPWMLASEDYRPRLENAQVDLVRYLQERLENRIPPPVASTTTISATSSATGVGDGWKNDTEKLVEYLSANQAEGALVFDVAMG